MSRPLARARRDRPARRVAEFPDAALQTYLHGMLDVTRAVGRTLERHVLPRLPHWSLETGQHNRPKTLERLDAAQLRVAIVGGPNTGKTTLGRALAKRLGLPLRHSDDLIGMGWSEASAQLAVELGKSAGGIVEGVAVARALRKLLEVTPGKPLDALVRLRTPHVELSPAQLGMTRGHDAILDELLPELERRGVVIVEQPHALERLDARRLITRLTVPASTLDDMRARFARAEADLHIDITPTLRRTAERAAAHARTVLERQVADALGVTHYTLPLSAARHDADKIPVINPFDPRQNSGIGRELDEFVRSNTLRVRAMTHKMYTQAQITVRQGLEQGLRPDALAAKLLREVRHLAPQEAVAIANHAVGTFHAKQTELRQKALGIKQYKWLTAGDVKVRPGHRALEGSIQSWDAPPIVDPQTGKRAHPGFDTHFYACRCQAIPVIDAATVTPPSDGPFGRPDVPPPAQPDLPGITPPLDTQRVRTTVPQPRLTPAILIGPEQSRPIVPAPQPTVVINPNVPRPPPSATSVLPPALDAPTRQTALDAMRTATADLPATGVVEGADLNRASRTLLELGGLHPAPQGPDTQLQIERVIGATEAIRAARNQRTGRLRLRTDVAGALRTGLEALDAGETPTLDQFAAVAAVLREHAFGMGRARAFAAVPDTGAWLAENVTAEVNARRITRELAGLELAQLPDKHPLGLPTQSRLGAYQIAPRYADSVIAPTMHALAELTGWTQPQVAQAIEVAAQRYKALAGSAYTSSAEALRAFVSTIPDLDEPQRAALLQRLDDPRQLTQDWLLAKPKKPAP